MSSPFKTFRPITEEERAHLEHDATLDRLRRLAVGIATREQFERIIATAAPDSRDSIRELLEPMLAKDLPCCSAVWSDDHTVTCPARSEAAIEDRL